MGTGLRDIRYQSLIRILLFVSLPRPAHAVFWSIAMDLQVVCTLFFGKATSFQIRSQSLSATPWSKEVNHQCPFLHNPCEGWDSLHVSHHGPYKVMLLAYHGSL